MWLLFEHRSSSGDDVGGQQRSVLSWPISVVELDALTQYIVVSYSGRSGGLLIMAVAATVML